MCWMRKKTFSKIGMPQKHGLHFGARNKSKQNFSSTKLFWSGQNFVSSKFHKTRNFLSTFTNSFDCWKGSKTKIQQFWHPHIMSYLIQYFNNVWCSSVNNQSKFLECCRNFSRLFIFNGIWMSRKVWSMNVKRFFHLISLAKSLIDKSLVLNEPLNNEDH